jgi:hypothetical protein
MLTIERFVDKGPTEVTEGRPRRGHVGGSKYEVRSRGSRVEPVSDSSGSCGLQPAEVSPPKAGRALARAWRPPAGREVHDKTPVSVSGPAGPARTRAQAGSEHQRAEDGIQWPSGQSAFEQALEKSLRCAHGWALSLAGRLACVNRASTTGSVTGSV